MAGKRSRLTPEFKTRVVRAALREDKTLAELAAQFGVRPNQIAAWRRRVLKAMPKVFWRRTEAEAKALKERILRLVRVTRFLRTGFRQMKRQAEQHGFEG